jgi:multisubunit Na+/H+ antiporter MnhB subunit
MIFDFFEGLNWLAIVVATVAWFAFNAIWYSVPPISQAWQAAAKISPTAAGAASRPPVSTMVITYLAYLVTVVVIALLVAAIGADDVGDGLALGVSLGIAFSTVFALTTQLYEQKGSSYWLINGVAGIVGFSIVSIILALWD